MTTTTARSKVPMDPMRKTALIAGVAYLLTFAGSIPALALYDKILSDPNYILGDASNTGVLFGVVGELICALTGIVTAIALWPVARRYSERAAMGFVTARTLDAVMIFAGILSVLSIVTLQDAATTPAGADSMATTGRALVAFHDWTFLLGPGLMSAINALCIGTVMYRSGLISKWIPTLGLIGAPLLLASSTGVLFGAWEQVSGAGMLLAMPIAVWELSFGCHMTFKGFKSVPVPAHSNGSSAPVADPVYA